MLNTSARIAAILLLSTAVFITVADARPGGGSRGGGGGGGGGHAARSGGGGGGGGGHVSRSYSAPRAVSRSVSAPRIVSSPRSVSAPRVVTRSYSSERSGTRNAQTTVKSFAGSHQGNRNAGVATQNAAAANAIRNAAAHHQWQGQRNAGTATRNAAAAAAAAAAGSALASHQWHGRGNPAAAGVGANAHGQRFGLASVGAGNPARVLSNRFLANRPGAASAFARATFNGHFANWSWRHHNHRRFFAFPLVIGWLGPVYWPYAYDDFVGYTFYPHAYDSFWPYAYDDLYAGMFGRYAYGYSSSGVPAEPGRPVVATNLCSGESSGLTNWPIEQIAQTVEPNEAQRAALEGLRGATAQALDMLKAACPTDLPSTPTGRLEGMRQRLEVMVAAVRTVRPALGAFYQSLSDEQKARFNALGPDESPDQQQTQQDLAQMCGERASGIASLPFDRIESTVRPNNAQRVTLDELHNAMAGAVGLLKSDCPTDRALTPVGRVEAMEQRLDAMLRAVQTVQPALSRFYGSLSDEQKERFNRLAPQQS